MQHALIIGLKIVSVLITDPFTGMMVCLQIRVHHDLLITA